MKIQRKGFLISLLCLLVLFACGCQPKQQTKKVAPPLANLVFFTNQSIADFSIVAALENGEFARLEALAASLRKSKATYDNGQRKLTGFYHWVAAPPKGSTDDDYLKRLKLLEKWSIQKPPSITADVALSHAYLHYAWKARGEGFANTVSREGWRIMRARVNLAKGVLLFCKERRTECSEWWSAMQWVALAEGWDRKTYNALLAEALQHDPNHLGYYSDAAYFLTPIWQGKPGEWEKFITEAADKIGGEDGDIFYAQVIWRLQKKHAYGNIFQDSQASWARTEKGFQAMRKRNPESLPILSEYCNLAGWGSGSKLARTLFDEIGNRVDLHVWGDAQTFIKTRQFVYKN